ncbi:MAG TPA: Stk1 family PASTA domain-containing Ser/Thr kinase [Acidothermaceae bacterium]
MDATVSDSLVGQVLDGRYKVESRIAKGGMATVYRALDVRLDRLVAIKVMHQIFADDDEFVARFIREAKSAARLSHPNVVAVFDQGDDNGHVFLAMEYVPGRTLRDLLRERRRLAPQEALSILAPVLSALSAAHAAGLVHRDVKPENVLLADDGRVKVADFGLARAVAGRTATSATTLIGTVAYLAPEQVTRGVADPRSDVYAAGIMLFEMLTGHPPYDGETPISVAYRHANETVPPPSSEISGLPPAVDALVTHATARDPDARPADAAAFLAEVARVRRGLPALEADAGSATTVTPRGHQTLVVELPPDDGAAPPRVGAFADQGADDAPRPRRRSRRGLIALLLVLLLAAGAGSAGWWFGIGQYTTMPSFLQMSVADAQAKAADAHVKLVVSPDQQWSSTVSPGDIIDQSVQPNHQVKRGAAVTVHVSKGKHTATVPAVDQGASFDDYKAALQQAGFKVAPPVMAYNDNIPANGVIGVDPAPGTVVDYGKAVTVTVSQGPQPIAIKDYTGQDAAAAANALQKAGFQVATTQDFSDTVPEGKVISQNPNSGNGVRGQTVTLDVSKGPELFKVPDVTSDLANPLSWTSISQAEKILTDAGFKVKVGKKGRFGVVTHQDPKGGSMKPKGTVVTIDAS